MNAAEFISAIADGRADGSMSIECVVREPEGIRKIAVSLADPSGKEVIRISEEPQFFTTADDFDVKKAYIDFDVKNVSLWSCENPAVYTAHISLIDGQGGVSSRKTVNAAFRTVEIRREDGIYINNLKTRFKGATVKGAPDAADAASVKNLNANAVRLACALDPNTNKTPDYDKFLSACDRIGLYVMFELPAYASGISEPGFRAILRNATQKAAAHPCIVLWSAGFATPGAAKPSRWWRNEDGENEIKRMDPANRAILRPGAVYDIFDAPLFPPCGDIASRGRGRYIYLPVATLPVDGERGGAAGLPDYWNAVCSAPHAAGLFIDWTGDDSDWATVAGREVIRRTWSDVSLNYSNGAITFRNNYATRNLNSCSFEWDTLDFRGNTISSGSGTCPICEPSGAAIALTENGERIRIAIRNAEGRIISNSTFVAPKRPVPAGKGPPADKPAWLAGVSAIAMARTNMVETANGRKRLSGILDPATAPNDTAAFEWSSFGPDKCIMTCTVNRTNHRGVDLFGVVFNYDTQKLRSVRKSSAGPDGGFANRPSSQSWGIWDELANGFFENPRWLEIDCGEGWKIRFTPIEGVNYFGIGSPENAPFSHVFPKLGIGLYTAVPAAWSGMLSGGALGASSRQFDAFGIRKFKILIERIH